VHFVYSLFEKTEKRYTKYATSKWNINNLYTMICKRNSESVFDNRLGGKHAYIYELQVMRESVVGEKTENLNVKQNDK